MAKRSDGAFDVTVSPLVRLWRIARRTQKLPDPAKLAAAKELVGYDKVRIDADKHTVLLTKVGMQLDLGGIAKGYAADAALAVLRKDGIDRALGQPFGDLASHRRLAGAGTARDSDEERPLFRFCTASESVRNAGTEMAEK